MVNMKAIVAAAVGEYVHYTLNVCFGHLRAQAAND